MFPVRETKFKDTLDFVQELNNFLAFYGFEDFDLLEEKNSNKESKKYKPESKLSAEDKEFLSLAEELRKKISFKEDASPKQLYKLLAKDGYNYTLSVVRLPEAFAEVLLVSSVSLIAQKFLSKNIKVELNSIGSFDCFSKYLDDVRKTLKRKRKFLPKKVFNLYEKELYEEALLELVKINSELLEDMPLIADYIDEESQKHLYSFLGYLEDFNIEYSINPFLLRHSLIWNNIVFNIYLELNDEEELLIARGGRLYTNKPNKENKGKLCALIMPLEKIGRKKKLPENKAGSKQSKFFFAQSGPIAKAQAIVLLEQMMKAKINVEHTVSNMSLLEQYELAYKKGAKYIIILGHKEAIEKVVIVRNLDTQTQEVVPQEELIKYLKKLR